MRSRGTLQVLVVFVLALAPLAPLAAPLVAPADRPVDLREDRIADLPRRGVLGDDGVEPVDAEVLVTVKLRQGATLPDRHSLDVRRTYTRRGAGHVEGYVSMTAVRELSHDPRVEAVRIERASLSGSSTAVAKGVSAIGADRLHAAGVTGESVTVGVIDSGFRVSDPEIASNVGAHRAFSTSSEIGRDHGTAVASVVADTAPGARLHLAAVGDSTTPTEYREAIRWLHESGADVIVDSGSYFGSRGDGAAIERVAAAASNDTVFVVAAGNYARRHWAGTHDASHEGEWVDFAANREGNVLAGGEPIRGRVRANLRWTPGGDATVDVARNATATVTGSATATLAENATGDAAGNATANATENATATPAENATATPAENATATVTGSATANVAENATADYDLYLLRVQAGRDAVIARSTDTGGTTEHLDVTVTRGRYYLAVKPRNATGTHRLELFASRRLADHAAAGSLTVPATAPGVLTVGASEEGRVAPFSSRGSAGDGPGVDLVAPDTVAAPGTGAAGGTSYAAPYVAGTAALVVSEHPEFSARQVEDVLRASAVDVGPPGADPAAGYGRVDAPGAVRLAASSARYAPVNATS